MKQLLRAIRLEAIRIILGDETVERVAFFGPYWDDAKVLAHWLKKVA